LVLSLLDEGFDVNARDGDGMTPLLWAIQIRDAALTTLLMSNKAIDVNARSTTCGYTPLSIAARKGDQATVQLLLAREEIDVNVPERQVARSHIALSIAGALDYPGIVELLSEPEDTKADSRDEQGTTPLMKAAHRGNACIVKFLLARSEVDVLAVDDNGATPLSSAEERWMGEANMSMTRGYGCCIQQSKNGLYPSITDGCSRFYHVLFLSITVVCSLVLRGSRYINQDPIH